jgi:hypothetical protein
MVVRFSELKIDTLYACHLCRLSEKQKAYDFEKYLKTGSGRAVMNKRLV